MPLSSATARRFLSMLVQPSQDEDGYPTVPESSLCGPGLITLYFIVASARVFFVSIWDCMVGRVEIQRHKNLLR